jgi:hypothetical protein
LVVTPLWSVQETLPIGISTIWWQSFVVCATVGKTITLGIAIFTAIPVIIYETVIPIENAIMRFVRRGGSRKTRTPRVPCVEFLADGGSQEGYNNY